MSALVPYDFLRDFLGLPDDTEQALVESLRDSVEAFFLAQANRTDRPFAAAVSGRVEVLDGTGTARLDLAYPIADVTTLKLGRDPATPDETLDPDDLDVVSWRVGRTRVTRVDGGCWGNAGAPAVVHVTYNTQAHLPADARLAIARVVAAWWRQRGSEDATGERVGGWSTEFATLTQFPEWAAAVRQHWLPCVV